MKKIQIMIISIISVCLIILVINFYVIKSTEKYIYNDINKLPVKGNVLILGALVHKNSLSLVLEDRVVNGLNIIKQGKADKILLTGDHGRKNYDEVNNMRIYIQKNADWLPAENIFMDHAGFDTYDSMYRAKEIFEIKQVIIVTQSFHINRAVFIAKSLGIDAVGYSVNQKKYYKPLQIHWELREIIARAKAFKDVILNAKPKFLGEKIPITGSGLKSWDEKN